MANDTALLPLVARVRLEKAATDNGFDQPLPPEGRWLCFASTRAPLRVWLSVDEANRPLVAFSQHKVVAALASSVGATEAVGPVGARGVVAVADMPAVHGVLRRAFQLSRALPHEPRQRFEKEVAGLPRATEAKCWVVQRVGQNVFREALFEYWDGHCAVTGLGVPELLRASHIKPWAACDTDDERLDVFNGLLLAPHLDAAFDRGFVTVTDDGAVQVFEALGVRERQVLGVHEPLRVRSLEVGHRAYLSWHRQHLFRR